MVDDANDRKVRIKQSKLIAQKNKSVSYSSVINDVLYGKYKL